MPAGPRSRSFVRFTGNAQLINFSKTRVIGQEVGAAACKKGCGDAWQALRAAQHGCQSYEQPPSYLFAQSQSGPNRGQVCE